MIARSIDDSVMIRRPRLEKLVAEARTRRLTTLIAGPGFGKTTIMAQVFDPARSIWHTVTPLDSSVASFARAIVNGIRLLVPDLSGDVLLALEGGRGPGIGEGSGGPDALAARLAQDLAAKLTKELVLVVDEVHELAPGGESARFLEALCRHAPPHLHVVAASRQSLPFPTARMTMAGEAGEVRDDQLSFTASEVRSVVQARSGVKDDVLAEEIFQRTAGWPVAVVYAVEAVARGGSMDVDSALRGETLLHYLAEEVLSRDDEQAIEALGVASRLPWLNPELLEHLNDEGKVLTSLQLTRQASHLLISVPGIADAKMVTPLLGGLLQDRFSPDEKEVAESLRSAARWYESAGHLSEALTCLLAVQDREASLGFLKTYGNAMMSRGLARQVAEAVEDLGHVDDPEVALLAAEARQLLGDWEGAMAMYRVQVPEEGSIPARIAWRLGFLHHMRGDVSAALDTYRRGRVEGESPADGAALYAWTASAHWLRGQRTEAERLAKKALVLAQEADAPQTLATAHTVLAMVAALDGDRAANDMHYLRALEHAERARDVVQTIRIRSNRGSYFLEEGNFDAALAELEIALNLADMTGFELWRGMALANRGQVVSMLGSLEEAISDLTQARAVFRGIGSSFEAYPLAHLGDVYALRGDLALSRACYEEAIAMADRQTDLQALVPALSGLARLLASEDVEAARILARRASEVHSVIGRVRALVTMGWVELESGDAKAAEEFAQEAADVAGLRRDLPGLADAVELRAHCGAGSSSLDLLDQARSIWKDIGCPVGVARVDIAIAKRLGGADGISLASTASQVLGRLGAKGHAIEAGLVADRLAESSSEGIRINTLGGFGVSIAGSQVPVSAWQSKVARDILAMLVAARGRTIHREVLIDRLWPDDDPVKASNRLSVALTTIRTVLDPDRDQDPGFYLKADRETVALSLGSVVVDVEVFLEAAARGLRLLGERDSDRGLAILKSAESMYLGDFLEDHPYDDWSVGLREEARAVYVKIASVLADADTAAGDHDNAARRFLRMLERDPFNEQAHLSLVRSMVRSGRHGTARRLYGIYVSRMAELEVEPEAFPA